MKPPLCVKVKICGITNRDDALAAIDAGADALGFNLFSGSRRAMRLEALLPWLPSLVGGTLRVAVLVNPSIDEIRRVQPHFDAIQLHGQETPALCAEAFHLCSEASGMLWKAFPLTPDFDAASAAAFQAHGIVIDSSVPGAFGGTGALIDLDRAADFVRACPARPVWLSGGLHPANIAAAVEKVRPFGVDVASGVELPGDPRRKDSARVRAFIAAARQAATSVQ